MEYIWYAMHPPTLTPRKTGIGISLMMDRMHASSVAVIPAKKRD